MPAILTIGYRHYVVKSETAAMAAVIQCTVYFDGSNDGLMIQPKSSLGYFSGPASPATNTPDDSLESWHWPTDKHIRADGTLADE